MLTKDAIVDRFFLLARARVIELAALMDRLQRSEGDLGPEQAAKLKKLRAAIAVVLDEEPDKAKRVQMLFSLPYDGNWRERLFGKDSR